MNANELIEELEDAGSFFEDALYLKSAALLRKQQAEIEALKKLVHQRFDDGKRLGIIETEDRLRKAQDNG